MDPLTAGMAGSAVIGTIGSLFGGHRSDKNAAKENEKNRQFQREMFDKSNEWNRAENVVQRMKNAGLNPYLQADPGSPASATASPSSVDPTKGGQAISNASQQIGNAVSQFGLNKSQINLNKANEMRANAEAQSAAIDNMSKFSRQMAELDNLRLSGKAQEIANRWKPRLNAQLENTYIQNIAESKSREYLNTANLSWLGEEKASQLANMAADTQAKIANGKLTMQQFRTEIYNTSNSAYQSAISRINSQYLGKERAAQIKVLDSNYKRTQQQIDNLMVDAENARKRGNMTYFESITNQISKLAIGAASLLNAIQPQKGILNSGNSFNIPSPYGYGYYDSNVSR